MSPLWLLLIVPLSATVGFMACALISHASMYERCPYCDEELYEKDEEVW